jgi:hypothetical protein
MTFKLFDDNLVNQSIITPSTVNAQFPVSNFKDTRRTKVFRSNTPNDYVIFDLQETSAIDCIMVMAEKRSGFGVQTITVEFNQTSNFTAPPYSIEMEISHEFGVAVSEIPTINYRFCRLVLNSSLPYCELSNVFIGKSIDLNRCPNKGWTYKNEELSQKTRNRYGQLFTDIIFRQRVVGLSFNLLDKNQVDLFNKLIDRSGESSPVWLIILNEDSIIDNRRFTGPYTLDDIPTIANTNFGRYSLSMSLREVT